MCTVDACMIQSKRLRQRLRCISLNRLKPGIRPRGARARSWLHARRGVAECWAHMDSWYLAAALPVLTLALCAACRGPLLALAGGAAVTTATGSKEREHHLKDTLAYPRRINPTMPLHVGFSFASADQQRRAAAVKEQGDKWV